MIEKYALFRFETYYPLGGASDFCDLYDTLESAEQALDKKNELFNRANIVRIVANYDDSISFELVANYHYTDYGIDSGGRVTYDGLSRVERWIKAIDNKWQEL